MRGTQPEGMDLKGADFELATRSFAYSQVRDMVNWWMSGTAKPDEQVKQVKVVRVDRHGLDPFRFVTDTAVAATGGLCGQANSITAVKSHSLGGYLSSTFKRLFGASLDKVQNFNSAGLTDFAFDNLEADISRMVQATRLRNVSLAGGAPNSPRMLDARLVLEWAACRFSDVDPQLAEYRSRLKVGVDSDVANGNSWRYAA